MTIGPNHFKSSAIFGEISEALKADGEALVKRVKGIYAFKVKTADGKEGLWIVDAKNGSGAVEYNGKGGKTGTCRYTERESILFLIQPSPTSL